MKLTIVQPDESVPLARASFEIPKARFGPRSRYTGFKEWPGRKHFQSSEYTFNWDRILQAHGIMRLTPWRNDKTNRHYFVCEVRIT